MAGDEAKVIEAGEESKYTLDQIVLPLPGSKMIYPKNAIGKVFEDVLQTDGVTLSDFESGGLK